MSLSLSEGQGFDEHRSSEAESFRERAAGAGSMIRREVSPQLERRAICLRNADKRQADEESVKAEFAGDPDSAANDARAT